MGKVTNTIDVTAEEILRLILQNGGISKTVAMNELGITDAQFVHGRKRLTAKGFAVIYSRSKDLYSVRMKTGIGAVEQQVIDEIDNLGLTQDEIESVLSGLKNKRYKEYSSKRVAIGDRSFKFGVISDLHIGSDKYRYDLLEHASEDFRQQDVDFVVNAGDTLEGWSGRKEQIMELQYPRFEGDKAHGIGMGAQKKLFGQEFQRFVDMGIDVFSIEPWFSHTSWGQRDQGEDIGNDLSKYSKAYRFIGYGEQDIKTDYGLTIRLRHPGGGSAQTWSHMIQKYIRTLGIENRPDVVINGHFHKTAHVPDAQGVAGLEAGCFQDQTIYMQKIGTPAHVGYWVVTIHPDEGKIVRMLPEWVKG